ncbi:MAG: universal stress protein [Methylocystis sp.]|uniref:universal stress protein n=1 Tax=Methylocystis sp. TaxID=1911079 RepID=UPI003DA2B01E
MFKKILLPVDLADPEISEAAILAALALALALALAKISDADLRLVYVQFSVPIAFADYVPVDLGDRLRLAAEEKISELADSVEYAQERVSSIVRFGGVASEVLAEANDWPADLITLGSHRPGIATYLLGSHAAAIVRHASSGGQRSTSRRRRLDIQEDFHGCCSSEPRSHKRPRRRAD